MQLFCPQLVQWAQLSWTVVKFGLVPATEVVQLPASDMRPSWTGLSAARRRFNFIRPCRPCPGIWVSKLGSYSCFLSKVLSHCPVIPVLLATQSPRKGSNPLPSPTQQPHSTVARWLLLHRQLRWTETPSSKDLQLRLFQAKSSDC